MKRLRPQTHSVCITGVNSCCDCPRELIHSLIKYVRDPRPCCLSPPIVHRAALCSHSTLGWILWPSWFPTSGNVRKEKYGEKLQGNPPWWTREVLSKCTEPEKSWTTMPVEVIIRYQLSFSTTTHHLLSVSLFCLSFHLELLYLARLTDQRTPWICLLRTGFAGVCYHNWLLTWVLGIRTQVLMLISQAFYPLSHFQRAKMHTNTMGC